MKKIIITLLALSSLSTFASNGCEVVCTEEQNGSLFLEALTVVANSPNSADIREAFTRTCIVLNADKSLFYKNKIQGIEVTGYQSHDPISRSEQRYYEKHGRFKPSTNEKKIEKQNHKIEQMYLECISEN